MNDRSLTGAVAPSGASAEWVDLKRKSVRGGTITLATQGTSVVIQLASTVILARLLSPDDYGLMAMVLAVTAFAGLFRDLGLSSAAVQTHRLTHAQQSNLFWINVVLGCTLCVLVAAAAPLVAGFYSKPDALWVTVALSANFLIGSISAQSGALLVREMRFGRQAVAGVLGALLAMAVAVTLALLGARYWALVWGQLTGTITTSTLLFMFAPFRPGLPSRGGGLAAMIKFGANITGYDLVNYFSRNLDNILIGRYCGAEMLGLYSRAYTLLMFPINNLRGPMNAVAFPAMSRLLDQPQAFRAYYRRITLLLALASMPLSAFLFVEARTVIKLVLGPKWEGVIPIFAILASVGFVQPVFTLWGVLLMSSGLTGRYFRLGVINTLCTVIGFGIGLSWGPVGVATAYAIVTYVLIWPTLTWAFRGTPVKVSDFVGSIAPPAFGSIVAVLACLHAQPLVNGVTPSLELLILAALFGGSYLVTLFAIPQGRRTLLVAWKLVCTALIPEAGEKCRGNHQPVQPC